MGKVRLLRCLKLQLSFMVAVTGVSLAAACSIFSSKLAEPPEGLQVMGVEDPDFTSLCRLAKEPGALCPARSAAGRGTLLQAQCSSVLALHSA